jgi:hypothetical protein
MIEHFKSFQWNFKSSTIILLSQILVLYNLIYILFVPRLEVASGEVGYYSISFWPVMEIQTRKVAFAGVWYDPPSPPTYVLL